MYNRTFLNENYDRSKSVLDNVESFKEKGVNVSDTTLYRFAKEFDIIDDKNDKARKREEIIKNYNPSESVYSNLKRLKKEGFDISKSTLYRFAKEFDIDVKEEKRQEIIKNYNPSESVYSNLKRLKKEGFDISKNTLYRMVNSGKMNK